jgi:hypothetical protein
MRRLNSLGQSNIWPLASVASMGIFFHLQATERMKHAIRAAQDSKWLFEL